MKFKRMICALDFGAWEAFCVAVDLARIHSGTLLLFHVTEIPPALPGEAVVEH